MTRAELKHKIDILTDITGQVMGDSYFSSDFKETVFHSALKQIDRLNEQLDGLRKGGVVVDDRYRNF